VGDVQRNGEFLTNCWEGGRYGKQGWLNSVVLLGRGGASNENIIGVLVFVGELERLSTEEKVKQTTFPTFANNEALSYIGSHLEKAKP